MYLGIQYIQLSITARTPYCSKPSASLDRTAQRAPNPKPHTLYLGYLFNIVQSTLRYSCLNNTATASRNRAGRHLTWKHLRSTLRSPATHSLSREKAKSPACHPLFQPEFRCLRPLYPRSSTMLCRLRYPDVRLGARLLTFFTRAQVHALSKHQRLRRIDQHLSSTIHFCGE